MSVVREARSLLGIPWRYKGRSLTGVDCVGLVVLIAWRRKLTFEDFIGYGRGRNEPGFLNLFTRIADKMSIKKTVAGDIMIFSETSHPGHCGILTDARTVIHCSVLRGKVVESNLQDLPGQHIATFRMHHG